MRHPIICNTLRSLFVPIATVLVGLSSAQTPFGDSQTQVDLVPTAQWTAGLHPSIGPVSAPIKVVFFVDYQCPTCRTADPLVRRAIARRSDVALIYREFPLRMHQWASQAAIVAENAHAHGTFDVAHHRLMEGKTVTLAAIKDAARRAHVSLSATPQATKRIDADHALEQKAKIAFVPSFIVIQNGKSTLMSHQQVLDFLK